MMYFFVFFIFGQKITLTEPDVDADACVECHDEREDFAKDLHFRLMTPHKGMVDASCETCHGPAAEHEEDATLENILTNLDQAAISQKCATCHPSHSPVPAFGAVDHSRADLNCLDCHTGGHGSDPASPMLQAEQGKLCGDCHEAVRARFYMPNAHRRGHSDVACSDCHGIHDAAAPAMVGPVDQGACARCHTGEAGPFVFPHPPHETDGCLACHEAHGSANPFMLKRADVNQLCLECHADTPVFHDLSQPRFRNCVDCHSAVHGSQRNPQLLNE
jgi:DmsE family decaheme c-type cytochrome